MCNIIIMQENGGVCGLGKNSGYVCSVTLTLEL